MSFPFANDERKCVRCPKHSGVTLQPGENNTYYNNSILNFNRYEINFGFWLLEYL